MLYYYLYQNDPILAYVFLGVLAAVAIFYILIPAIRVFFTKRFSLPAKNPSEIEQKRKERMEHFAKNKLVIAGGIKPEALEPTQENYDKIVDILSRESAKVRKKYVSKVFYITAIVQNGFLDALFILSLSVQLINDTFKVFNGRPPGMQMWDISKKIYYSIIIGGSEAAEYASEELFQKLASEGVKGIPFAGRIVSSLTDGFVNATLLTRVALITENYCKKIYFKNAGELFPSGKAITETTTLLSKDVLNRTFEKLKQNAGKIKDNAGMMMKKLFTGSKDEETIIP